jgi:DNA repair exonuclease SbcCD nuclease subunit
MVRFLHTADWHLGIKYAKLGPSAERARETRIRVAEKIAYIAKQNNVDFVIVAGDLFDSNEVDRELIAAASKIVEGFAPIPVFILPGNHDPLTRDSLYLDPSWKSFGHVVICKTKEPLKLPHANVILYPCPVTQKQTREDLTEWIRAEGESISIGIAHGNLRTRGLEDVNFPIDAQRARKAGLDYLALGEWHSLSKCQGEDGIVRTAYPGTPEATKFGEDGSGKILLVDIEGRGAQPVIREIETGVLKWERWWRDMYSVEDVKHLERELTELQEPQLRIINVYCRGMVDHEVMSRLESLEMRHAKNFLSFDIIKDEVHLRPNIVDLKALMPQGALFSRIVDAIGVLRSRYATRETHPEMSPEETQRVLREIREIDTAVTASPEVLDKAILLLYQLAKEISR